MRRTKQWRLKFGDIVYVVRHHIKNHKNIGYYIDKCRVCDFGSALGRGIHKPPYRYVYIDHNLDDIINVPNKNGKRIYVWNRIHKDIKEAQKECDLKNKLIEVRKRYNNEIENIKRAI